MQAQRIRPDYSEMVEEYITQGIIVVPILTREELLGINAEMCEMIKTYPEFDASSAHPVMGGFGAHATPSSFHHSTVQKVRSILYDRFSSGFLPALAARKKYSYWHMLYDRVASRGPDIPAVSGETWHYDTCIDKTSGAEKVETIGGWFNLNVDQPQHFYGLRATFGDQLVKGVGYSALDKSMHGDFEKLLAAQGGAIVVPPGHALYFKPEIVHKVRPGRMKHYDVRLYIGHVMSNVNRPLFGFDALHIDSNVLPQIPSGQLPPIWAQMTRCYRTESIRDWTVEMKVKPKYVANVTLGGKRAGEKMDLVVRFMLHPTEIYPYTDKTRSMMLPMAVE